jgi:hypothetical protein
VGTPQKVVAAIGIAVVAYVAGYCGSNDSDAVRDAKARADSLQGRVSRVEGQIASMFIVDAMRKDSIQKLNSVLKEHKETDKKLAIDTERLKAQVRQQISDSAFRVVEPLITNYEARLEAMAVQNRTLQQIVEVQGNQVIARDTTIDALRRLNTDLKREVDRLNGDLRKVSSTSGIKKAIITVGLIGVGVYAVTR